MLLAFLNDWHDAHLLQMLKLAVRLGKTVVTTDLLPLNDELSVLLEGNFTFATEPDGPRDPAQGPCGCHLRARSQSGA